jgi:hypothetical protein
MDELLDFIVLRKEPHCGRKTFDRDVDANGPLRPEGNDVAGRSMPQL